MTSEIFLFKTFCTVNPEKTESERKIYMKKRIISAILSGILTFTSLAASASAYGERGIFRLQNYGDYQIFCTTRTPHAAMRTGSTYLYNNYGVLDSEGKLLVNPEYEIINPQKDGRSLYKIYKDNVSKYGYFNENWEKLTEPVFDDARDFSEGVAIIGKNIGAPSPIATTMRYGVIDRNGTEIIPAQYHRIDDAKDGKIAVYLEEQTYPMSESKPRIGYYSTDGTLLEEPYFRHDMTDKQVITYANSVSFGEIRLNNTELQYPIVSINDGNRYGCFLPLTYENCKMLGLGTSWTPENGLAIWNSGEAPIPGGKGTSVMPEDGKAVMQVYTGEITINGEKYTNKDAPIPMLYYKDIVYLPLYWTVAMYELGLFYSYSLEKEMEINFREY